MLKKNLEVKWDTIQGSSNSMCKTQRARRAWLFEEPREAHSEREPGARSEWSFSCRNDGSLFGKEAGCFPNIFFLFAGPGAALQRLCSGSRCP